MNCFSSTESISLLKRVGPSAEVIFSPQQKRKAPDWVCRIPQSAPQQIAMVRAFAELFNISQKPILWIASTDAACDNSSDIFNVYRRAYGEMRNEADAPGTLFGSDDLEAFVSLTSISLFYLWDTWIVETESGALSVEFSHDEILSLWVWDSKRSNSAADMVSRFGLKVI
jgi:hypothetical protein